MKENILLVTGASSEVGIKIIEAIHLHYTTIYAHYSSDDSALMDLKKRVGDKLVIVQDDFREVNAGQRILSTIEDRSIWPNHVIHLPAPKLYNVRFSKTNWDDFENNLNISVKSAQVILKDIIKRIIKDKKNGRIIFMLSSVTENLPPKFMVPYVTSKYTLLGVMKALSVEYASKNIMINGISPGMMETKFLDNLFDHVIEENASNSPFGRNLLVEEVIPAIEFLLSEGAARITGQNIVIGG